MLVDNLWNSYIFVVPVYDSDGQIVSVINRLQRSHYIKNTWYDEKHWELAVMSLG